MECGLGIGGWVPRDRIAEDGVIPERYTGLRETESAEDRNKGKLFIWFTDDAKRLPVMVRTIIPIGSVTARLKRLSGSEPARPISPPAE